jgi:hypothetical protein
MCQKNRGRIKTQKQDATVALLLFPEVFTFKNVLAGLLTYTFLVCLPVSVRLIVTL